MKWSLTTRDTIQSIELAFPSSYNISGVTLIERVGIGAGKISLAGNTIVFTVDAPVTVAANTPIRLELSNIVNKVTTDSALVTFTTKNTGGTVIDGPTAAVVPLKQITTTDIGNDTVSNIKLGINAVTGDKIADGSIGTDDLATGAVTRTKIGMRQVNTENIQVESITERHMQPDFLVTRQYPDRHSDNVSLGRGWNPDGVKKSFNVITYYFDDSNGTSVRRPLQVQSGTSVYASLDFGGSAICSVADMNPSNIPNAVQVSCDRPPANGAKLNLLIINGNPMQYLQSYLNSRLGLESCFTYSIYIIPYQLSL